MTTDQPGWGRGWAVGLRVWVERGGRAVLGKGRLDLLRAIDRCRSISAAARQLGMSYRRAWLLIDSLNGTFGQAVVQTKLGGKGGGAASLTAFGEELVARYRAMEKKAGRAIAADLEALDAARLAKAG